MSKENHSYKQLFRVGWDIFSTAMHSVKWYTRIGITAIISAFGVMACIWGGYTIMTFAQFHPVIMGCTFFFAINIKVSMPMLSKLKRKLGDFLSEEPAVTNGAQPAKEKETFAEVAKEFEEELRNIDIDPNDD